MPHFPVIDRPCTLDADTRGQLDGHCAHCDKAVHRLDHMDEAARRRLLAEADGPICVAYAAPSAAARRGRFGAAIAATLICTAGLGGALPAQAAGQEVEASATGQTLQAREDSDIPMSKDKDLDEVLLIGGIDKPRQALLTTDTRLPELPMRRAQDLAPLDAVPVGTGTRTPGNGRDCGH